MISNSAYDFSFEPSACATCEGSCCIGESAWVWVSDEEIAAIANYLNLDVEEFTSYAICRHNGQKSLAENERDDGTFACIYFDDEKKGCSIYPVRPEQCRSFPFWDEYLLIKDGPFLTCPGICHSEK